MTIYTIGHSNHPWERFLALLTNAKIEMVIDVRSYPRSRWPQFNKDALKDALSVAGIRYRFCGTELGGRNVIAAMNYQDITNIAAFREAMREVVAIAARSRAVLMCSEHDPLQCHRCLLLARNLAERNVESVHLLRDGQMEDHAIIERRLLYLNREAMDMQCTPEGQRLAKSYDGALKALFSLSAREGTVAPRSG